MLGNLQSLKPDPLYCSGHSAAMSRRKPPHWGERVREVSICRDKEDHFNVSIEGGADNAQFIYVGELRQEKVLYKGSGRLGRGDVILEVNGRRISGLIRKDAVSLIKRSPNPLRLTVTKSGVSVSLCSLLAALE